MEFESIIDFQVRAMKEGIEKDLDAGREQMRAEARKQARSLLRNVRRQCRSRVALAVAEERAHRDHSLQKANAALASRVRRRQQALDRKQLVEGYRRLREALVDRWSDADARSRWARTLIEDASAVLSNSTWCIEYPASLPAKEAQRLFRGVQRDVELVPADELEAGFRLRHDDARLDMSVDGLLAQVDEMAGELLAEIHRQQAKGATK
jgi:vacuolar-type H+-ATPase subunit E/Vma4